MPFMQFARSTACMPSMLSNRTRSNASAGGLDGAAISHRRALARTLDFSFVLIEFLLPRKVVTVFTLSAADDSHRIKRRARVRGDG
jgi:hypothetical protein